MAELDNIPGYFPVSRDEAKQLIAPHLGTDGYYILRPTDGDALCTICVSNKQKLMNYRLCKDPVTGLYFVRDSKFPSIASLIKHYEKFPLNDQFQTYLRYPVQQEDYVELTPSKQPEPVSIKNRPLPQQPSPRHQMPTPSPSSSSSIPPVLTSAADNNRRRTPSVPNRDGGGGSGSGIGDGNGGGIRDRSGGGGAGDIANLPGVHINVSKTDVPVIMQAFLGQEGAYLVRPSVSSNGQFTISLTCEGSILNFKINTDSDNKVFITPKKKFSTIQELLEGHKTAPLRSKARPGAKVFLLVPITAAAVQQLLLPPPWQEFYDANYKRSYYYNTQTGQSVWERPRPIAPPTPTPASPNTTNIGKSKTMGGRVSSRPLPSLPSEETMQQPNGRNSLDVNVGKYNSYPSPGNRRASASVGGRSPAPLNKELPSLPPKDRKASLNELTPPPLPSKVPSPTPERHNNRPHPSPSLPPKTTPTYKNDSIPPPLPSKDLSSPSNGLPPLPNKDNSKFNSAPPLPAKDNAPPLPVKDMTPPLPLKDSAPPLPLKDNAPPLPLKDNVPPLPSKESFPPLPDKDMGTPNSGKKPRPVEYFDTVITKTPPSPALPSKSGSGPPPPPPPPPIGAPAPPPPPPILPPSDTPPTKRAPPKDEPPRPSPADGRPFDVSDLVRAKSLLKAKTNEEREEPKRGGGGGGLQDVFCNAIDQRMMSIRSAVGDSDDDTDIEEVDDDDWED